MNRAKLFIENMLVFGLGGIISKLIPVIMVPIITRLLPDTVYYGISDLCSTMISFGSSVAIMGMYDALFRLFFDKENDIDYQKRLCSTAFIFTQISGVVVFLIMVSFRDQLSVFVFDDVSYSYLVIIAAIGAALTASYTIISSPTRMQNQRKVYLTVNTVLPVVSYAVTIPLILRGFYIIALPIATIIADTAVVTIYWILNHKWFSFRCYDKDLLKPLLQIAIPLFPSFLIYWIFNSSDKLMISNMLDVAQVGIYSAGAKIGQCSNLIYTAFAGGWSFFAFKTMKDSDQVQMRGKIFEYLGSISFTMGILVFACAKAICSVLYTGDYQLGYIVAPYLFMAPLMQMLFQVAANQFTIQKKPWLSTITLMSGVILNIILNFLFIPILGIEGAAIASLAGYTFSTVTAVFILIKMRLIHLSLRCYCIIGITVLYIIFWRYFFIDNFAMSLIIACLVIISFALLYRKNIRDLLVTIKG